ncbi:unnamed protein product, partial [Amoebophrya sp. A25]
AVNDHFPVRDGQAGPLSEAATDAHTVKAEPHDATPEKERPHSRPNEAEGAKGARSFAHATT